MSNPSNDTPAADGPETPTTAPRYPRRPPRRPLRYHERVHGIPVDENPANPPQRLTS